MPLLTSLGRGLGRMRVGGSEIVKSKSRCLSMSAKLQVLLRFWQKLGMPNSHLVIVASRNFMCRRLVQVKRRRQVSREETTGDISTPALMIWINPS